MRASDRWFSLSSFGGEGWGEETVTSPDAAVCDDIRAGWCTNATGVLAENDDLLSLPLSSKGGEGNAAAASPVAE